MIVARDEQRVRARDFDGVLNAVEVDKADIVILRAAAQNQGVLLAVESHPAVAGDAAATQLQRGTSSLYQD